jgi:hypothetical protein
MGHLAKNVHLALVNNPVTAASTFIVGTVTWVDMQNYEGCLFMATFGAASTGATFTVQYNSATSGTGTALSGASVSFVAADANKAAAIDVYKPHSKGRYLRPELSAGMAAAGTIDFGGFLALRYNGRKGPLGASTGLVDGDIDLVVVQTT